MNDIAINEVKQNIMAHIDEQVANLEKDEYASLLGDLIDDLTIRKESADLEAEEEAEENED